MIKFGNHLEGVMGYYFASYFPPQPTSEEDFCMPNRLNFFRENQSFFVRSNVFTAFY